MKCIGCNKNEGTTRWYLYPKDFEAIGYPNQERFDLENCFCDDCYESNGTVLDKLLLEYWKTLQESPHQTKEDLVNNPGHYTWLPGIECQKVVQHFNFNLGNVIKYVWRVGNPQATKHDSKEGLIEDLQKAIKYLEFEIDRLKEGK